MNDARRGLCVLARAPFAGNCTRCGHALTVPDDVTDCKLFLGRIAVLTCNSVMAWPNVLVVRDATFSRTATIGAFVLYQRERLTPQQTTQAGASYRFNVPNVQRVHKRNVFVPERQPERGDVESTDSGGDVTSLSLTVLVLSQAGAAARKPAAVQAGAAACKTAAGKTAAAGKPAAAARKPAAVPAETAAATTAAAVEAPSAAGKTAAVPAAASLKRAAPSCGSDADLEDCGSTSDSNSSANEAPTPTAQPTPKRLHKRRKKPPPRQTRAAARAAAAKPDGGDESEDASATPRSKLQEELFQKCLRMSGSIEVQRARLDCPPRDPVLNMPTGLSTARADEFVTIKFDLRPSLHGNLRQHEHTIAASFGDIANDTILIRNRAFTLLNVATRFCFDEPGVAPTDSCLPGALTRLCEDNSRVSSQDLLRFCTAIGAGLTNLQPSSGAFKFQSSFPAVADALRVVLQAHPAELVRTSSAAASVLATLVADEFVNWKNACVKDLEDGISFLASFSKDSQAKFELKRFVAWSDESAAECPTLPAFDVLEDSAANASARQAARLLQWAHGVKKKDEPLFVSRCTQAASKLARLSRSCDAFVDGNGKRWVGKFATNSCFSASFGPGMAHFSPDCIDSVLFGIRQHVDHAGGGFHVGDGLFSLLDNEVLRGTLAQRCEGRAYTLFATGHVHVNSTSVHELCRKVLVAQAPVAASGSGGDGGGGTAASRSESSAGGVDTRRSEASGDSEEGGDSEDGDSGDDAEGSATGKRAAARGQPTQSFKETGMFRDGDLNASVDDLSALKPGFYSATRLGKQAASRTDATAERARTVVQDAVAFDLGVHALDDVCACMFKFV